MKDQQTNFTQARLASLVRRAVDKVVAQVSNLLYRSASSLRMARQSRRSGHGNVLPIGNRRYSRLETCATPNWSDFVNSPGLEIGRRNFQLTDERFNVAVNQLATRSLGIKSAIVAFVRAEGHMRIQTFNRRDRRF